MNEKKGKSKPKKTLMNATEKSHREKRLLTCENTPLTTQQFD